MSHQEASTGEEVMKSSLRRASSGIVYHRELLKPLKSRLRN